MSKRTYRLELNLTKLQQFNDLFREFTDKAGNVNKTITLNVVQKDQPDQYGYDAFVAVAVKKDDPRNNTSAVYVGNGRSQQQVDKYFNERQQREYNDEFFQ